jgi:hypothetical protein
MLCSTVICLVVYLPLWKYDFVSWDYDIPNWMESHKSHVPNHQPVISCISPNTIIIHSTLRPVAPGM